MKLIIAAALAALVAGPAAAAIVSREPTLTVTQSGPGLVDLQWFNVPTSGPNVVKFTFTQGEPCSLAEGGCDVLVPNDGYNEATAAGTEGFQICSAGIVPQVCTQIKWITVN